MDMTKPTENELFEQYWQEQTGCNGEYIEKDDKGRYYERSSREAWAVWQARAELADNEVLERVAQYFDNGNMHYIGRLIREMKGK